jgi:hypothetical protein
MDSTFAPNYAHLLELTAISGDSAKYDLRLAQMRSLAPAEARLYQAVSDVRWSDRESALAHIGAAFRTDGPRRLQLVTRVMMASSLRAFSGSPDPAFMLAAIDSLEQVADGDPQMQLQIVQSRAGILGMSGRVRAADAALAPLRSQGDGGLNSSIQFIVSGMAPEDAFVQERRALERAASVPPAAFWLAMKALFENDAATAERHLAVIDGDTVRRAFIRPEMVDALKGWATAVKGDTVAGVARMRTALRNLGYAPNRIGPSAPIRLQFGLLLAARPETRAEGIRRVEQMILQEGALLAFAAVPLAEAYIADGRLDDARSLYARFIQLWRDADPELQPRVQAAADALARISGERGTT